MVMIVKVKLDIPYPKVRVEEKNPYYADLLMEEIAKAEMIHLELLGKTIKLLGKNPIYSTCEASRGDCIMWNSNFVNYSTDLKDMLKIDISSEEAAIKTYTLHKKLIDDKYIKEMLDRIIMDEKRHLEIFNYLYDGLCKSNV